MKRKEKIILLYAYKKELLLLKHKENEIEKPKVLVLRRSYRGKYLKVG